MRKSKEADREYHRKWRREHLEQARLAGRKYASSPKGLDHHYREHYGLSYTEYEALLAQQGGLCAICRNPPKKRRLSVDHNHKTKVVRGLLCIHCNKMVLGGFRDNHVLVHQTIAYLQRHFP